VKELGPFLAKGNGVVQDGLAGTSQLITSSVGAHETTWFDHVPNMRGKLMIGTPTAMVFY
jgi:hypothetical protein